MARPVYDPARLGLGMVHIGVGAFHRAHQAVFTDAAIAAAGGDWGVIGLSLRTASASAALNAQDGLFTVERLGETEDYAIVGCLRRMIAARIARAEAVRALADPAVKVVTLTVTEPGYCLGPSGGLDLGHPDILADLAAPERPTSAVGWIVHGLAVRRASGAGPLTVIACDNVIGAGRKLAEAAHVLAERRGGGLARWIETHAAFPDAMVDCIVPAPDAAVRARVEAATGLSDLAAVSREPFAEWVIERRFAGPVPAWDRVGASFVSDVSRHERLKLGVLNAAHSALAYLGPSRGARTTRDAMADPELAGLVDAMVSEEIAPALADLPVRAYWARVRPRIANPRIDHALSKIAADGSAKLAQRIFPVIVANVRAGRGTRRLAAVVRAWLAEVAAGRAADPLAARIAAWAAEDGRLETALDDPQIFPGAFRSDARVRAAVLEAAT